MATMLVSLTLDPERTVEVVRLLRGEMAPWMRRQPGFVSSNWYLAGDRRHCTIRVEFDHQRHAEQVARATEGLAYNAARSWNVERVEVVDDLDLAPRPGVRLEG